MSPAPDLDVERVVCRLSDLDESGARAFTIGTGDWPLRGFVVRSGAEVSEIRGRVGGRASEMCVTSIAAWGKR